MRILAEIERSARSLPAPVIADRLRDREDMRPGECAGQGRAAMTAGAEAHPLRGIGEVGLALEESTLERRDVDQDLVRRRLAGKRG